MLLTTLVLFDFMFCMQAVFLCGGLGTRLRPLTNTIPKPMVPINGRPFLEYTVEALKWHNITNILFLTGYLGEKIKEHFGDGEQYGISASYSHEGEPIGVGGSIRLAEPQLEDVFLLLYGDVYLPIDYSHFVNYFNTKGKKALVAVFPSEKNLKQPVYVKNHNIYVGQDGTILKANTAQREPEFNYREAGVSLFKKEVVQLISSPKTEDEKFMPLSHVVFNSLIREKEIFAYESKKSFCEIGTPEEVVFAQKYIKEIHNKK